MTEKKNGGDDNRVPESGKERESSAKTKDISANGAQEIADAVLPSLSVSEWHDQRTPEQREAFLQSIETYYSSLLTELSQNAFDSLKVIDKARDGHRYWRLRLIVATGSLAILSFLAAFSWESLNPAWTDVSAVLSLIVGAYAAALAMAHNIESFHNYPERAHGFREAFELYVGTYREFEMLWHLHIVRDFDLPENCANAAELYRRLTDRAVEVRRKVKELTAQRPSEAASVGRTGGT